MAQEQAPEALRALTIDAETIDVTLNPRKMVATGGPVTPQESGACALSRAYGVS